MSHISYIFHYSRMIPRNLELLEILTAQKMKCSIKDFFSKCDQISFLRTLKALCWKVVIHASCLQQVACNKLEQKSFNNIVVMKVSVVFEFNSTNNSSADTNLERRHQPSDFIKSFN